MKIKWFSLVRISGLVMVLLYHFYQTRFPGGFIGVDLFFTFSGFLITALIIEEFGKKEQFDLAAFYQRRFYRIVPPLVFSVLVSLPFALLVSRDFIANIGKQIAAAIGFVTNYYEIFTGGSYENQFIPHLFLHTWSLAIEVHYYILWAIVLFFMIRQLKKSSLSLEKKVSRLRQQVFLISFFIVVLQILLITIRLLLKTDQNVLYFSDLTHSFPFFIGSGLASLSGVHSLPKKFQKTVAAWSLKKTLSVLAGSFVLLFVLSLTLRFNHWTTYLFGFLMASLLAAGMIFSARILHEKTPNTKEPAVVSFLADTSYGVYLFHWPLIIIFDHAVNHTLAVILTLLFSYLFASLSYYLLEPLLIGKEVTLYGYHFSLKAQKIPLAVIVGILTLFTLVMSFTAPKITSLEKDLWLSNVQQDVDNLSVTRQLVDNKTATEYNIPSGVSIIGDSVTLGARDYLSQNVDNSSIDAQPNRNMTQANQVIKKQIKKKILREYVVICIGTNALADYKEQTLRLIKQVPAGHHIILMTPYDGQADATFNSSKLAVYERTLPKKYDYITLADWNKLAPQHKEIFGSGDGTHFAGNQEGNRLYTKCINDALKKAKNSAVKTGSGL